MEEALVFIIVIGLIVAVFGGFGYLIYKSALKSKEISDAKKKYESLYNATLKHVDGLPVIQGSYVDIYYCNDKIVFLKDGQEISVSLDKVIDIDNVTGKDIKTQQATGAAAGALVFGGISGAVIGAMAATAVYIVISYKSNDELKSIILGSNGFFGSNIKKEFKKNNIREEQKIEL